MRKPAFGIALIAVAAGAVSAAPLHAVPPQRLAAIADNLARHYPNGLYNRMAGQPVNGADSTVPLPEIARAAAFTPPSNMTVKRIQLALWTAGGTNGATVALYTDVAGVPGTALKTWHVQQLPALNTCCGLVTVKSNAGIPVQGGQVYWVVVKADGASSGAYVNWAFNTSDQNTFRAEAIFCKERPSIPCSPFPKDQWSFMTVSPGVGFAVLGE